MPDYSLRCATCKRPTLHRAGWSLWGICFVASIFGAALGLAMILVPCMLVATLLPPVAIRCQRCGRVNGRRWGEWIMRVTFTGALTALAIAIHAHGAGG